MVIITVMDIIFIVIALNLIVAVVLLTEPGGRSRLPSDALDELTQQTARRMAHTEEAYRQWFDEQMRNESGKR